MQVGPAAYQVFAHGFGMFMELVPGQVQITPAHDYSLQEVLFQHVSGMNLTPADATEACGKIVSALGRLSQVDRHLLMKQPIILDDGTFTSD